MCKGWRQAEKKKLSGVMCRAQECGQKWGTELAL